MTQVYFIFRMWHAGSNLLNSLMTTMVLEAEEEVAVIWSRPYRNIFFLTFASRADIGSSIRMRDLSAYTALAKLILAFYPPLRVIPFSPISVSSPAGRISRSLLSQQILIVSLYFARSKSSPKSRRKPLENLKFLFIFAPSLKV